MYRLRTRSISFLLRCACEANTQGGCNGCKSELPSRQSILAFTHPTKPPTSPSPTSSNKPQPRTRHDRTYTTHHLPRCPTLRQDIVHEDLTVRENLAYSARLRLSAAKPASEKAALVEDCVDLLQLRHVQHQVVGSVERRGIRWGCGGHGLWRALAWVCVDGVFVEGPSPRRGQRA